MPARSLASAVTPLLSDGSRQSALTGHARDRCARQGDGNGLFIKSIQTSRVNYLHAGPVQDVC